jgi:hypothetical protein
VTHEFATVEAAQASVKSEELKKTREWLGTDNLDHQQNMRYVKLLQAKCYFSTFQSQPGNASRMKGSRTKYRRFATAAEAIRYAVEDLRTPRAFGAWLQVGDERFNSVEIQRLYEADDYPLRKAE